MGLSSAAMVPRLSVRHRRTRRTSILAEPRVVRDLADVRPRYGETMAKKEVATGRGTQAMWLALGGYVLLFAVKIAAFAVSHVGVMFAEAMHSMADMLIAGFLLVAAYM